MLKLGYERDAGLSSDFSTAEWVMILPRDGLYLSQDGSNSTQTERLPRTILGQQLVGFLRDDHGNWLLGYSRYVCSDPVLQTELPAV